MKSTNSLGVFTLFDLVLEVHPENRIGCKETTVVTYTVTQRPIINDARIGCSMIS